MFNYISMCKICDWIHIHALGKWFYSFKSSTEFPKGNKLSKINFKHISPLFFSFVLYTTLMCKKLFSSGNSHRKLQDCLLVSRLFATFTAGRWHSGYESGHLEVSVSVFKNLQKDKHFDRVHLQLMQNNLSYLQVSLHGNYFLFIIRFFSILIILKTPLSFLTRVFFHFFFFCNFVVFLWLIV